MLADLVGVFQGKVIEVHIGTLLADQAFTFTDWTAEMKAKASICIYRDTCRVPGNRQEPNPGDDRQGHGLRQTGAQGLPDKAQAQSLGSNQVIGGVDSRANAKYSAGSSWTWTRSWSP